MVTLFISRAQKVNLYISEYYMSEYNSQSPEVIIRDFTDDHNDTLGFWCHADSLVDANVSDNILSSNSLGPEDGDSMQ
jgi:hypothetical protein